MVIRTSNYFHTRVILAPLGLFGSRLLFVSLVVVAIIAWVLQRQLEESKDWEEENARQAATAEKAHPYKELFSNVVNRKSIMFLVGVYLFWNLVAGAMGFFMPFVYETVGGLTNSQANMLQAVLWILTSLASYFGFAKLGDKVNQRKVLFL